MTENAPPLQSYEEAQALLTAPGAPFELIEEEVLGEKMAVFKARASSLRELLGRSESHGDATYLIFDDGRQVTYAEHLRVVASVATALERATALPFSPRTAPSGL